MSVESVEIQSWRLDDLRPHPDQQKFFGVSDEGDIRELAANFERNGQKDPISILPDGTIVCGHNRVAAARLLGWKTINAIVRKDLADDRNLQIEELLTDNLARRNLRPLPIARAYLALHELPQRPRASSRYKFTTDYLQRAAERLGMSPRNVRRYFNILNAPVVVQDAFDRGELTLTRAIKAASAAALHAQIVAEVEAGSPVALVVKKYLSRRPATKKQGKNKLELSDALNLLLDLDVNTLSESVAHETLNDLCVDLITRANELQNWNSEVLKSRKSAKPGRTADCRPLPQTPRSTEGRE